MMRNYSKVFSYAESKSSVYSRRPKPEISDNPENLCFPDYRGFPVPADENEGQICILQV